MVIVNRDDQALVAAVEVPALIAPTMLRQRSSAGWGFSWNFERLRVQLLCRRFSRRSINLAMWRLGGRKDGRGTKFGDCCGSRTCSCSSMRSAVHLMLGRSFMDNGDKVQQNRESCFSLVSLRCPLLL